MKITSDKDPSVAVEGGRPMPIASAEIRREVECSYLADVLDREGRLLRLPVGARVALFEGPAEVFVGVVQADGSVLDLLSSEATEGGQEEYVDL